MPYAIQLGGTAHSFASLRTLLAKASPLRSGDQLAGVAAHDAERNCVSNIRPESLPPDAAAQKLHALLTASRRLQLSGIQLKDDTPLLPSPIPNPALK